MTNTQPRPWWQTGLVYQIYPRSLQDSNGDGVGDLPGITRRLDYFAWLGVDALWISPIYPSPMADFGYDVSDYRDVHPLFGTLDDMDTLIQEAHGRGLKIILDFVPNHTSDQHPWFTQSKSSRTDPKRDWYIWRDPAPDGGPPNNWLSRFDGQSAWTWDAATGQYYLHSFLKEQPDLNWRNTAVRQAMFDNLRFWFRRGVDGFRVDVSYRVMKDPHFRDNPPNPNWREGMDPAYKVIEVHTKNTPDIHEFNRWLRQVSDEFHGRVLIGEINLPLEKLVKHYGQGDEFHLPFNFQLIFAEWSATAVRELADRYEQLLPADAWPNWVLGNHDQHRIASRVGLAQARVAQMLLLTLRGTPTLYYGDELGMTDVEIPPDKVQDPWEKFVPGLGLGRDPERTPMPWDGTPHAGFCPPTVTPWLPLGPESEVAQVNVATLQADDRSILQMVRGLIGLRKDTAVLNTGHYRSHDASAGLFVFERYLEDKDERVLVLLNFTGDSQTHRWLGENALELIFSTHMDSPTAVDTHNHITLRPHEGLLIVAK
ncbi:MAG: alpha-glucosidase [Anaerolineales bacterium]|nr:alpha-glucosidase [Anaerolineales bacterium]